MTSRSPLSSLTIPVETTICNGVVTSACTLVFGPYLLESSTPAAHLYVSTLSPCAPIGSRLSAPSASARALSRRYSARSLLALSSCSFMWGCCLRQRQSAVYDGIPCLRHTSVSDPPSAIAWHTKSTNNWLNGSPRVFASKPGSTPFCSSTFSPLGSVCSTSSSVCPDNNDSGSRCTARTPPVTISIISINPVFGFLCAKVLSIPHHTPSSPPRKNFLYSSPFMQQTCLL